MDVILTDKLYEILENALSDVRSHSERDPKWCCYHCRRTAGLALKLRAIIFPEVYGIDEIIFTTGLFHDIQKHKDNHEVQGAEFAREKLRNLFDPDILEKISYSISVHDTRYAENSDKDIYPDYVKIVQDADLLDHDGIIDIWNNFYYCGACGKDIDYAISYFDNINMKDIKKRSALLNYDASREILNERFNYISTFFENLKNIQSGTLC